MSRPAEAKTFSTNGVRQQNRHFSNFLLPEEVHTHTHTHTDCVFDTHGPFKPDRFSPDDFNGQKYDPGKILQICLFIYDIETS